MKASLNTSLTQHAVTTGLYDVIIVGAGPYGLATAAHLRAHGLNVVVFGTPLQLWRENMPKGMLLRSYWWASNISDPQKQFGLDHYFQETCQEALDPLPAEVFVDYGLWYQRRAVPDVDTTHVQTVERQRGQFLVTLTDGRVVGSQNVVLAPGLRYYTYRPEIYKDIHPNVLSHSAESHSFERFAGKQVVIIGGGQSALETAALARESGAHVHLVARRPLVWIQEGPAFPTQRSQIDRLLHPKAGISPGWFSWSLEHAPYTFQLLPPRVKTWLLHSIGSYGPMGAAWLKPRVIGRVSLYEGQHVLKVDEVDDGIKIQLSGEKKTLKADHIILGTGYRVNVRRLPMLHPSLFSMLRTSQGAPVLNNHFQSSIEGLYFVGFTSMPSCGPLYRFVIGTDAAARRTANSILRRFEQKNYHQRYIENIRSRTRL